MVERARNGEFYRSRGSADLLVSDRNAARASVPAHAAAALEHAPLLSSVLHFDDVYRQHFDFVCRSLRLLGVTPGALEDAAQDVFGVASRRLDEFEGKSTIKTWLFAIVQRVAANHRRSQRRRQSPLEPLSDTAAVDAPTPEANALAAQSAALIQSFCDELDEGRRALLVLALIEGVPVRELASTLDIPLYTVYSRIRALRRSLELFLRQHEVDCG
jgi:RNA polymerase sigma-70 factor, ECF subfamily